MVDLLCQKGLTCLEDPCYDRSAIIVTNPSEVAKTLPIVAFSQKIARFRSLIPGCLWNNDYWGFTSWSVFYRANVLTQSDASPFLH